MILVIVLTMLLLSLIMMCIMMLSEIVKIPIISPSKIVLIPNDMVEGMNVIEKTQNKYCYNNDPIEYNEPYFDRGLLNDNEIETILRKARNNLTNSEILSGLNNKIRNSKQTWIKKNDPDIREIIQKIITKYNLKYETLEDLQVVRYENGEYYRQHHDSCCDNNAECDKFITRAGNRVKTILIYLNDNYIGGETEFVNLGKKFKGKKGDALIFDPLDKSRSCCHEKALHEGKDVISGTKWIANIWVRERNFN